MTPTTLPVETVKHGTPKRFADPDSGSGDEGDDELEVAKLNFVILRAAESYENKDWEKVEGYYNAALKVLEWYKGTRN